MFNAKADDLRRPPLFSLLLISAAALSYEILLMRLFAIIQWHHFAYMIISLALLGYGFSGTFVTLTRDWIRPHFNWAYLANGIGFALFSITGFLLVQELPFNALEILWDGTQWLYLLAAYLLLLLPFFFAANCIVLTFDAFKEKIPRIYGFDLIGAGFGSIAIVAILFIAEPQEALLLIAIGGVVAVAVAAIEMGLTGKWGLVVTAALVVMLALLLPHNWLTLKPSPYKPLSQYLQISGSEIMQSETGPLGLIHVLENRQIPFRIAEGVSLANVVEPPRQYAVFIDGDAPSPITRNDGDKDKLAYLDYQTSAIPYHLVDPRNVLILGVGGGSGILQAEYHGVPRIEAVEQNPQLIDLLQQQYAEFAGWPFLENHVRIYQAEARGFVSHKADAEYDVIQMSLLDAAGASSAGLYALSENYLYTGEGMALYYRQLSENGLLSITRWVKAPPRDTLKLFATAIEALKSEDVSNPGKQIALIRGWNTSTLLIKRGAFTPRDIQALKDFIDERSFDIAWYPGMKHDEANRYNIMEQAYFHIGAKALLGEDAKSFIDNYKFSIAPASDDRPYFFNFFKWESLAEILSLQSKAGFSLIELGYLVLVATLVQALFVSVILILLPLFFMRRNDGTESSGYRFGVMLYFMGIGLAYLFIEIAFIQRFILFLADPIYSVAVVLCGFLVFSGLGSFSASKLQYVEGPSPVIVAVTGITLFALVSLWLQPLVFAAFATQPATLKVIISIALIAPLAFLMGMPFPLALSEISNKSAWLLPWAWGVNGFASVMSAIIATLLAVHFGFSSVLLLAVALYISVAAIHSRILSPHRS